MVKAPLPSDDQRQASIGPARRVSTVTSSATMKDGVEADAELADEGGGFLARVFGRELVQEGLGAGAGDGAEPAGQVFAGHADAIVREGQRLGVGIDRDLDRERSAVLDQFRLGDRLVAQLLAGVGGVGDEFADENLPVGIDRMDHQLQQARNVGLEALGRGFAGRGLGVGGQGQEPLEDCWTKEMPAKTARRTRISGRGRTDASRNQRLPAESHEAATVSSSSDAPAGPSRRPAPATRPRVRA